MDGTKGRTINGAQLTLMCGHDQFLGERYLIVIISNDN